MRSFTRYAFRGELAAQYWLGVATATLVSGWRHNWPVALFLAGLYVVAKAWR